MIDRYSLCLGNLGRIQHQAAAVPSLMEGIGEISKPNVWTNNWTNNCNITMSRLVFPLDLNLWTSVDIYGLYWTSWTFFISQRDGHHRP